eukprot:624265-Pyramimonas_sp.AAC.1
MDALDKLEDPAGVEVSSPEGFHVVDRERFGRLGNSPGLGSRAHYIGSAACNTPRTAFNSDHGRHELIAFSL